MSDHTWATTTEENRRAWGRRLAELNELEAQLAAEREKTARAVEAADTTATAPYAHPRNYWRRKVDRALAILSEGTQEVTHGGESVPSEFLKDGE